MKIFTDVDAEYSDYLSDESKRAGRAEAICFPASEEEVIFAVLWAKKKHLGITTQGGRTGITAGAVPDGGLVVNLSRMHRIPALRWSEGAFYLTLEPGVLLSNLQESLSHGTFGTDDWSHESLDVLEKMKTGETLFFSPDPTETTASLGGMVSCNASGSRSFKYGSIRPYVSALRMVTSQGDVISLRRGTCFAKEGVFSLRTESGREITGTLPSIKSTELTKISAGYPLKPNMDLIDLFIGAEGTLGVITRIEVKLLPAPKEICGVLAFLPDERSALHFVEEIRRQPVDSLARPVAIELFGHYALDLLRRQREQGMFHELPELNAAFHTAVYVEYHAGDDDEIAEAIEIMCTVLDDAGGNEDDAWIADNSHERERLRLFRHAVPESVNSLIAEYKKTYPSLTKLGTDMAVPDDRLEEIITLYRTDLAAHHLEYLIFGHVGNNHLHVNIIPRNPEEYRLGKELYLSWAERVVDWHGTVSAEHGIGKLKVPFLALMYTADEIHGMMKVKNLFDPAGIFNTGNLF